ncbi:MAG: hypothetical protein JNK77_17110 [Saprospiraceae bacterium]|nr:hypothetical protein [Saprospiraceae bacterium]
MSCTVMPIELNAFQLFNIPLEYEEGPSITIAELEEFYYRFAVLNAENNLELLKAIKKTAGLVEKVNELIKTFGLTGKVKLSQINNKPYVIIYNYIKKYRPKNITSFLEENYDKYIKKIPIGKSAILKSMGKSMKTAIVFNLLKVPIDVMVSFLEEEEYNWKREFASTGFDTSKDVLAIALATGVSAIILSATAPVWVSLVVVTAIGIGVSMALDQALENFEVKKNMLNTIEGNYESPKVFIPDQPEVKVNTKSLYIR